MENKIENLRGQEMEVGAKQDALNAKTKFVETGDRKIAYRSIDFEEPQIHGIQPSSTL
jgi:hypothetical protein